jgi:hypothetical protein
MSYEHIKVSRVLDKTTEFLKTVPTDPSDPYAYVLDGIPMLGTLHNFCVALRRNNRHLKFGAGRYKFDPMFQRRVCYEVDVYMDGHAYTMMRVGYGDYSVRTSDGSKYMVYARGIRNEKYNPDRDQYYMSVSDNVERAVKNAKKYMRPYSPNEVAELSFSTAKTKFAAQKHTLLSAVSHAKDEVVSKEQVRTELFHLLDSGYEFLSPLFKEKVAAWRDAYQQMQADAGKVMHLTFIAVRLNRDELMCDVIDVLDASKRYSVDGAVTTYKLSELPEQLSGNLAALSMVEDGHYVEGVGLRVDSALFWVNKEVM